MKTKLAVGFAGLLLASSAMFAGWGVGVGIRGGREHRGGGVYVGVAPGYYSGYSAPYYAAPYPYAPAPYVNEYVAPAPYYGGGWDSGRWAYGARDRNWGRRYSEHRR